MGVAGEGHHRRYEAGRRSRSACLPPPSRCVMGEGMMDTRWKALFEAEPDAVLVVAGDGALREVNPAGLILFEAERAEEVVGRTLSAFLAPTQWEAFRSYVERVGGGHKGSLEVEIAGLKGGARTVLVRAAPLENPGRGASLLVLARDVTELRELESDLRESQKMAAVGQLAATFAHDFNNLLTIILGYTSLLLRTLPPENPSRDAINEIQLAAERGRKLTQDLLTRYRAALSADKP